MKIELKNVIANPHRHLDRCPLDDTKVDALKASIKKTGFWQNVIVRPSKTKKGKYELAYGHHRIAAARALRMGSVNINVDKSLSDETMLQMLADENGEWGSGQEIITDTVLAAIQFLATGHSNVNPAKPNNKKHLLKFEDFGVKVSNATLDTFTALQVAELLGWTKNKTSGGKEADFKVRTAIQELQAEADGIIDIEEINEAARKGDVKVGAEHTSQILQEARLQSKHSEEYIDSKNIPEAEKKKQKKQAKARIKKAATETAAAVAGGNITKREVRDELRNSLDAPAEHKQAPDIGIFLKKIVKKIGKLFREDKVVDEITALVKSQKDMSAAQRHELASNLEQLAERITRLRKKIKS